MAFFDIAQFRNIIQRNYEGWQLGTAATGVTAVEGGDKRDRWVELTISSTMPAIAGGANLAVGKLLYTFPPGEIIVKSASMAVNFEAQDGNIGADTPDVGLGTVIGTGVVATLDGTATFESILTGQTATNCSGTNTVAAVGLATPLTVATAGAHTVYLNAADGWAASGETDLPVSGSVVIQYSVMS